MPKFSVTSNVRLAQCHEDLQRVFNTVIETFDCKVLVGFRGEQEQEAAFAAGASQLRWPQSKHNKQPSLAADVAPYPVRWNDTQRFIYFAGFVMGVSAQLGVRLRWGGDWNRNWELDDNRFNDLVHFEIAEGG